MTEERVTVRALRRFTSKIFSDTPTEVIPSYGRPSIAHVSGTDGIKENASRGRAARASMMQHIDVNELTPLQLRASAVLLHPLYQFLMILIILAHMALTVFETDQKASGGERALWQDVCEWGCFMTVYVLDLSTRMFIQRWKFLHHKMNIFDLSIVGVDILCALLTAILPVSVDVGPVSLLRALRTLRIVRVMRNFIFFRDLYLMVKGMVGALRPILFAFLLIIAALTIFSIAAVELIHPVVQRLTARGIYDGCTRCPHAFSSVIQADLTFFSSIIAGDSWGKVSLPIMEESPVTSIIIVTAFGILELGLLNVVVAVVVDRQAQAREEDKELQHTLKEEKIKVSYKELIQLFKAMDRDGSGSLSFDEIQESYRSMDQFRLLLQTLDIREDDLETVFASMDRDGGGTIDYEEFVMELHRIRSVEMRTLIFLTRQNVLETKAAVTKLADSVYILASGKSDHLVHPGIDSKFSAGSVIHADIDPIFSMDTVMSSARATIDSTTVVGVHGSNLIEDKIRACDVLQCDSAWEPLENSSKDNQIVPKEPSTNRCPYDAPTMPSQGLSRHIPEEDGCFDDDEPAGDMEDSSAAHDSSASPNVSEISAAVPRGVNARFKRHWMAFEV